MNDNVINEIKNIVDHFHLGISVDNFLMHMKYIGHDVSIEKRYILSEDFIREFEKDLHWYVIAQCQSLSENCIKEFYFKFEGIWDRVCQYQKLSEDFIREFKDKVNWEFVSRSQKLSEDFIAEFRDKVDWNNISAYQKLSESFIRRFRYFVNWDDIVVYQHLSESFMKEFINEINLELICKHQKLSYSFIQDILSHVNSITSSNYKRFHVLHNDLIDKLICELKSDIRKNVYNWNYKLDIYKKQRVENLKLYEIIDDKIIAYKGIRSDNYSNFNFQYKYEVGETYETHCDCNSDESN